MTKIESSIPLKVFGQEQMRMGERAEQIAMVGQRIAVRSVAGMELLKTFHQRMPGLRLAEDNATRRLAYIASNSKKRFRY